MRDRERPPARPLAPVESRHLGYHGAVIAVHVAVTTAPDYPNRREPHRQKHIERLAALRGAGRFVGGGPAPDGRMAELFYRLERPEELEGLLREDPYWLGGAWTGYHAESFSHFVEPWSPPPVVLDGSRRVTIAEGPPTDVELAQLALVELRGTGRLAFGGVLREGETLAVLRSADPEESLAWLAETGLWDPARLTVRPLLYVL